jgi:hypothetical protein
MQKSLGVSSLERYEIRGTTKKRQGNEIKY